MNIFKEFEDVVDKAIELNHKRRETVPREVFNDYQWANEFCSVVVDVGRQVGKTTYAIKLCNKAPENSVAVVRNMDHMRRYKRDGARFDVLIPDEIEKHNLGRRKIYNTIIFDEPRFFTITQDRLMSFFVIPNAFQTFISLGASA